MKTKKSKKSPKRIQKIYGLCMMGMIMLVAVALFAPQIIFGIQDKMRMMNIVVEERESLDIANLNQTYEKQLYNRMSKFCEGSHYYVTAIDYEITEDSLELSSLMENSLYQNWIWILCEMGFFRDISLAKIPPITNIQECKKYIVYQEDYREGVNLMMWYLDFYLLDATRVQLLVDTESNTIYYLRATGKNNDFSLSEFDKSNSMSTEYIMYLSTIEMYENFIIWWDDMLEFLFFYSSYYEANYTNADGSAYVEDVITQMVNSSFDEEENRGRISFPLNYGELELTFQLEVFFEGDDCPNISVGITQIGELIPELIQN